MPAPLIEAALRAAAGQAAKTAAKKAATKAATKTVSKKAATTAAQRYVRAGARYLQEAEAVGSKTRYGQMLVKASRRLDAMADRLKSADYKTDVSSQIYDLVSESEKYLVRSSKTAEDRGNLLGETLLNGTMQGHRLFAITRDIWDAVGYENRYEALKEAFGGKNISDIILEIEKQTNVNIMKGDINSKERYGTLTREERMKVEEYIIMNYA